MRTRFTVIVYIMQTTKTNDHISRPRPILYGKMSLIPEAAQHKLQNIKTLPTLFDQTLQRLPCV